MDRLRAGSHVEAALERVFDPGGGGPCQALNYDSLRRHLGGLSVRVYWLAELFLVYG